MHTNERQYRPDVDGLRAVAVLLVLGFHLSVPQLRGGFVGVDVFLVISGYLIAGIIASQIDQGHFTITGFYERRARRILPALMVVLLASTALASIYLLPGELVAFGKSLLGACFSFSNFYFAFNSSYFDEPAQMKPLLHTWSLAVEEQFYLLLPILLMLVAKWNARTRSTVLILLAAASFAWSVWASYRDPTNAFYLPMSRAWELMLGSILAMGTLPPIRARWLREAATILGLTAIVFAATHFTGDTPFPGIWALLPCGGCFLTIAAGQHGTSLAAKVLSFRPITFVGLISYSVYLYHWPLIVFTRMGFLSWIPRGNRSYALTIVAASLFLGTISWLLVERPFRTGLFRTLSRPWLFGICGGSVAFASCLALVVVISAGLPSRFPPRAVQIAAQLDQPVQIRRGVCFIDDTTHFQDFRPDACVHFEPSKKNYLLLGDSHSAALWYGLSTQMTAVNIMQATSAGCKPNIDSPRGRDCAQMIDFIFGKYLPTHLVDALFVSARWYRESDFDHLRSTIEWCKRNGVPVVVFGPVMEYDAPLPKLLAYSIASGDPSLAQRHIRSEMFNWDRTMQREAENDWHVHYVSLISLQCTNGVCINYADPAQRLSLMKDDNHFSDAGSMLIAKKILAGGGIETPSPASVASGAGTKSSTVL
jgi:peptidoglycan/LPS O-acetylase OafA/YrhL